MNPYILLLGAFALWYIPTGIALYKMGYTMTDFTVIAIRAEYVDVSIDLNLINHTKTKFVINQIDMKVYLNDFYISDMIIKDVLMNANTTEKVKAVIRLKKGEIAQGVWDLIINKGFNQSEFKFMGIARANNRSYPFMSSMPVTDIEL